MYVFNYDPQTLLYTGGTTADFDQLDPGRILLPAFATLKPPPKFEAGLSHPVYVPKTDTWVIVDVVQPEPEPEPVPPEPVDEIAALRASVVSHLEQAAVLMQALQGKVAT
jgi:hypothetical protein